MTTIEKIKAAIDRIDFFAADDSDAPNDADPVMIDHDNCMFELAAGNENEAETITLGTLRDLVREAGL